MTDAAWIILIGFFAGASCSLLGVFLILRRMAMLGDAVSHSVLFGIVMSFLLSGSRAPLWMFLGAGSIGVLTAYLTTFLHHHGRVQEDASIGVTFTTLFAVAVILISVFAGQVDLDQDCVLYGEIAFAPFDQLVLGGVDAGPRAAWILGGMLLVNVSFVCLGYRQLKVVSFDPLLASSIGVNVALWHYLLMTFLSFTAVAAFESVGAILVVAMLVVPANAAFLLARSLPGMLGMAIVFSLVASVGGYYLAEAYDGSISAAMVLVGGAELAAAAAVSWGLRRIARPIAAETAG